MSWELKLVFCDDKVLQSHIVYMMFHEVLLVIKSVVPNLIEHEVALLQCKFPASHGELAGQLLHKRMLLHVVLSSTSVRRAHGRFGVLGRAESIIEHGRLRGVVVDFIQLHRVVDGTMLNLPRHGGSLDLPSLARSASRRRPDSISTCDSGVTLLVESLLKHVSFGFLSRHLCLADLRNVELGHAGGSLVLPGSLWRDVVPVGLGFGLSRLFSRPEVRASVVDLRDGILLRLYRGIAHHT